MSESAPETTWGYEHTSDEDGDKYATGLGETTYDDGSTVQSFRAHAEVNENGDVTHLDAAAVKYDIREDDGDSWQVGALTASADSVSGEEGLHSVGFQANLLEVTRTHGPADGDAGADDDVMVKHGASLGVGAAARWHDGTDVDDDGVLEYGAGFDIGFATVDARVESGQIDDMLETVDEVVATAESAYDDPAAFAGEVYDGASEYAEEAYSDAADYTAEVSEDAAETYDSATEAVDDAVESFTEWWNES